MKYRNLINTFVIASAALSGQLVEASYHFADFSARPPIHVASGIGAMKRAMTPDIIKSAYHLPKTGGKGTIAIIAAYDAPSIESDLAVFNKKFGLAPCTSANGCFEKVSLGTSAAPDAGWRMETALDVEWAHAIAPEAKILLVEAKTSSGKNLIAAVDEARKRADVVAVSMSWGGPEFADEADLDAHFSSNNGATFFAASGDDGTGASWPAASPRVIAVGGTHMTINAKGVVKETAWKGSGGGVSTFESAPDYQAAMMGAVAKYAGGMRAIPDVAYNADPATGYPVYALGDWHIVGGTSAGTPQWAAIRALSEDGFDTSQLYADKGGNQGTKYFRDVVSGKNGSCGYLCSAHKQYDFVTGLGSPLTNNF